MKNREDGGSSKREIQPTWQLWLYNDFFAINCFYASSKATYLNDKVNPKLHLYIFADD